MKKCFIIVLCIFLVNNLSAQCWKSVSVGYTHVLAIAQDNTLWGWGCNTHGQLGNGTLLSSNLPIQIGTDSDWKVVSAGGGPYPFTMAIKNNGTLWAWGNNVYGQVGDGTFINKNLPTQVGTETIWKSISAGYSHAMAVKTNGSLWTWGDSSYYALGNTNGYGDGFHRNLPAQVGTLTTWNMVSAGDRYSLALKTNGEVYGWGYNYGRPINANSGSYIMTPQLRSPVNTPMKFVSAGGNNSYDIKFSNNLLITYGDNVYGTSGGTTCAGCPSYYPKVADCGDDTAAIIKNDNTLWYTGKTLGDLSTTVQYTNAFLQLGTTANWKSVSVGNQSGAAITTDGQLWTWGWNFWGALGDGTNADSLTLVQVSCPSVLNSTNFHNANKFRISPNPVKEILTISNDKEYVINQWTITDLTGKIILIENGSNSTINVSELKSGMYLLSIKVDKFFEIIKFIKE